MNIRKKEELKAKNDLIISMVIERAKRDFPDDIALIGLTGSFSTGDYHEKSDLDLIIINNTERGWDISSCFILDDVGYDIYCTPWETRITDQSNLESSHVSCLIDLKILYYANKESLEKFNAFRRRALDTLAIHRGKQSYARAEKGLNQAKLTFADLQLTDNLGRALYLAASLSEHLFNTLISLNNTYFKKGVMRYQEELEACATIPGDLIADYHGLIKAKNCREIREQAAILLKSVDKLMKEERKLYFPKPAPDYDNLEGTYEELWCNCRNKLNHAVDQGDESLLFLTAKSAQEFLDELANEIAGTPEFDLMSSFDADNPEKVRDKFMEILEEFKKEYDKAGRAVKKYNSFEELYRDYMGE